MDEIRTYYAAEKAVKNGAGSTDAGMNTLAGLFVQCSREILKDNLAGVYLHGSAAMGCWQPEKSDLDFVAVVKESMSDAEKRAFLDSVVLLDAAGPAKGIEMSIVTRDVCDPFVYPTPFILHYSRMHTEWYRRDPADYIRKMNGTDKDLAAHFTVLRGRGICLYGLPVADVFGEVPEDDYLDALWEDVRGAEDEIAENPLYVILNLARVLAWLKEKKILSKKEGGEWGLHHLPEAYRPLLLSALEEYARGGNGQYDPESAKRYAAYMLERIRAERKQLSGRRTMIYYRDDELVVRDMEEADGPAFVQELTAQGWHPSPAYYRTRMQEQAEGKCTALTAVYRGKPAGYVFLFPEAEEGPFAGKGWPVIVDFNVLKKYQRRGIGGRLMDAAEQIAGQSADTVCLGVGLCGAYGSAQRMYVKRGYIPDGSGIWYRNKPCVQYETVCTVDDDLILFLSKKLPAGRTL